MARKFILFISALLTISCFFGACTEELIDDGRTPSSPEVINGHRIVNDLQHKFNTTDDSRVSDNMTASSLLYSLANNKPVDSTKIVKYPVFEASINTKLNDYTVTEDQLNSQVVSSEIKRSYERNQVASDCHVEADTLFATLNDGQLITVPVYITSFSVDKPTGRYFLGSDTLINAKISAIRNIPIKKQSRATYISQSVNTEYTVELLLKENNIVNPKFYTLHLKAYALRHIVSADEIASVKIDNKFREIIDDNSERLGFDKIIIMKSGETIVEKKSVILKRNFEAIDTYNKYVANFDYGFVKSNGLSTGIESKVRQEDSWTIFGIKDKYSADISNKVQDNLIVTDYSFYHERAVYKDAFVTVEFDYITPKINELVSKVSNVASDKEDFEKAVFHNEIKALYLNFQHNLSEEVFLYKTSRIIVSYDFRDATLKIKDDEVIASLSYVMQFSDGSEEVDIQSKSFSRSLVCKSNWLAKELNNKASTSNPEIVLKSSNEQSDGYWHFVNETRNISTIATLNASKQTNLWISIDPNNISYTRNGRTFHFDKIEFSAINEGSDVKLVDNQGAISSYIYSNSLKVVFGDNSKISEAYGSIIIEEKKIVGHKIQDAKLVVSDNAVSASLKFITLFNDGSENCEDVVKNFTRSLNCYTNWTVYSNNASPSTSSANIKLKGSDKLVDGFWSYVNETYDINTTASFNDANSKNVGLNGWNALLPNHIVYSRENVTHDFGKLALAVQEKGASVEKIADDKLQSKYKYTDNISVSCLDNTISSSAFGTIIAKAKVTDYKISDARLSVNNNNVVAELNFITVYSNGYETSEAISKTFQRRLICESNWKSVEENANQQTSASTVTLVSNDVINDGFWKYNLETRSITTKANLNSSAQENKWKSIDPNEIVFSREGKSYKFDVLDFSAVETGALINVDSETEELTNFKYEDRINVTFGSNSIVSSAFGIISVYKPWNPDLPAEWGKFKKAVCTVSYNEYKSDWLYAWSLHFEKGTLPVIIDKNASSVKINQSLFEYNTFDNFNGAVYKNGKWLNAVANDESHYMTWRDQNSNPLGVLVYPTAATWNWNNGRNSVFTTAFSFSIEYGGSLLVVKYHDRIFAKFKTIR